MNKQSLASSAGKYHESVMVKEVLESLHLNTGSQRGKYIDCTLGTGGHTEAIIKAGGDILGIEADPKMLDIAKKRLKGSAKLVLGNFRDIEQIAKDNNFDKVDSFKINLTIKSLVASTYMTY